MSKYKDFIAIVGGGAGGAELAVRLAKANRHDVLLIDQNPAHVWKPRLHELAGGSRRNEINEYSYAELADRWGFAFEQGELTDIDPTAKRLTLTGAGDSKDTDETNVRSIDYRILVLALGGVTPDMGIEGVLEHAFVLDRAPDAESLYKRFANGLADKSRGNPSDPLRIVIVGTGLTGVELAAHMASNHVDTGAQSQPSTTALEISILEADDTFMPSMDADVRDAARKRLEASGIAIHTGQKVTRVSESAVSVDDGADFPADITVWATGQVGPPIADHIAALPTNKKQQWLVQDTLQSKRSNDIFALGDCAYIEASPSPPTAQAASEQAEHLGSELIEYLAGRKPKPFNFQDKGTLLSFGEAGSIGKIRGYFGSDIRIRGRLSKVAYRGLERQHEYILLGATCTAASILNDFFSQSARPPVKVH